MISAPSQLPSEARTFLDQLIQGRLLSPCAVAAFLNERGDTLTRGITPERLGATLVQADLLTPFQLDRALCGDLHGLVLGPYRILDRLGIGGMGTVFLAEHCLMKRRAAVKVLPVDADCHPSIRQRFYSEVRVLSELTHPNIVQAFDAGELPPPTPDLPELIYLIMELVDGGDLDRHVAQQGPCSIAEACSYVRQAACGIQAAHDRHLVHRDIKPSNILLTQQGQAKLVDFGLARQFSSKLTDPRVLLGSVEFMAPEQSHDPSAVGQEADIYGLGATLFWLLTGEGPYPFTRHVGSALRMLQTEQPRRLRDMLPDVPDELDRLTASLLDRDPARRPPMALHVVNALTPFLIDDTGVCLLSPTIKLGEEPVLTPLPQRKAGRRVLIVDDEDSARLLHREVLKGLGCECEEAADGEAALALAEGLSFDLVLLELRLPGIDGFEVCRRLRSIPSNPNMKIVVVSSHGDANYVARVLPLGADDFVVKPFEVRLLVAKVDNVFRLKDAQDRSALLAEQLLASNHQLQRTLKARDQDIRQAHNALLFTMAKMAESREGETPGHLRRLQRYTLVLAHHIADQPPWQGQLDERFLKRLEQCVVLHDIGKIGLPEDLLLKPGALNAAERALVQTHPIIGDRILAALGEEHGASLEFLGMARDIVRSHHERWDGQGYPDGLKGDAIPAAARLLAVADVYDALRRQRLHKAAMAHEAAVQVMLHRSAGQFDPSLLEALCDCEGEFDRIYQEITE